MQSSFKGERKQCDMNYKVYRSFNCRAEKSGLRHVTLEPKAAEPRGDMDVMLSMRAQNVNSAATQTTHKAAKSLQPIADETRPSLSTDDHVESNSSRVKTSSPTPTVRSWASDNKPNSTAVSTLKGLFASPGRPRSPSRASSALSKDKEFEDSVSFSSRGNTLLSLLRSNGAVSETPVIPTHANPNNATTTSVDTIQGFSISSLSKVQVTLDQPIVKDLDSVDLSNVDVTATKDPSHIWGSSQQSLPPPPRSRRPWTSSGVPGSIIDSKGIVTRPGRSSFQGSSNASIRVSYEAGSGSSRERHSSDSVRITNGGFDTHDLKLKRTSISSTVSSVASGFHERDPRNPGHCAAPKRRSRMGNLPQMLTPPSGPPPLVPPQTESTAGLALHPYAAERSISQNSTAASPSLETADDSYSASKRLSTSSIISLSSMSTTQSRANKFRLSNNFSTGSAIPSKRASMPPPRPVPTFAIPPTPTTENSQSGSPVLRRLSFRDSLIHKPIKTVGTANAFPRKSQDSDNSRRPSTSTGSVSISLASVGSRPFGPRPPPPIGPLPPTPGHVPSPGQRTSIKRRLRLKSAPTPSPKQSPSMMSQDAPKTLQSDISNLNDSILNSSVVLLGEPITTKQNDLDFLDSIATEHIHPNSSSGEVNSVQHLPETSTSPVQVSIVSRNEHILYPAGSSPDTLELKSLSPPPRRGARQLFTHQAFNHSQSVQESDTSTHDMYERTSR